MHTIALSLADGHFVLGRCRDYQPLYVTAKNELTAGHTDTGLRVLFVLRHRLSETPLEDTDAQQLKKRVEGNVALWGEGFNWD